MSTSLTTDQFKKVLPKSLQMTVTEDLVNDLNAVMTEPGVKETFRDNLLSYTTVMSDGKFKVEQYIDAVKYVTFKLLGSSNLDAWVKTFPDRYQTLVNKGKDNKTISAHVANYNKNKLVNLIYEQTLVPTHILNADIYQKAINTQAELMIGAKSEKVRTDAANSLLHHLKPPEAKKVELDITHKEDDSIKELRNATMELVAQQKRMVASGMANAKEIAHSRIITQEGEVIDE